MLYIGSFQNSAFYTFFKTLQRYYFPISMSSFYLSYEIIKNHVKYVLTRKFGLNCPMLGLKFCLGGIFKPGGGIIRGWLIMCWNWFILGPNWLPFGTIWFGPIWLSPIWFGPMWFGAIWFCPIWFGPIWFGPIWLGPIWFGPIWFGPIWFGPIWFGPIWFCGCWFIKLGNWFCMNWVIFWLPIWAIGPIWLFGIWFSWPMFWPMFWPIPWPILCWGAKGRGTGACNPGGLCNMTGGNRGCEIGI